MPRETQQRLDVRQPTDFNINPVFTQVTARPVDTTVTPGANNAMRLAAALGQIQPELNSMMNMALETEKQQLMQERQQKAAQQVLEGDTQRVYGNNDYLDRMNQLYSGQALVNSKIRMQQEYLQNAENLDWNPQQAHARILKEELQGVDDPAFIVDVQTKAADDWLQYAKLRQDKFVALQRDQNKSTVANLIDRNIQLFKMGGMGEGETAKKALGTALNDALGAGAKLQIAPSDLTSMGASALIAHAKETGSLELLQFAHDHVMNNGASFSADPAVRESIMAAQHSIVQGIKAQREEVRTSENQQVLTNILLAKSQYDANPDDPKAAQVLAEAAKAGVFRLQAGQLKPGEAGKLEEALHTVIKYDALQKNRAVVSAQPSFYAKYGTPEQQVAAKEFTSKALAKSIGMIQNPNATDTDIQQGAGAIMALAQDAAKNGVLSDSPVFEVLSGIASAPLVKGQPVPRHVEESGRMMASIVNDPTMRRQLAPTLLAKDARELHYWSIYAANFGKGGHSAASEAARKVYELGWTPPELVKFDPLSEGQVGEMFKGPKGERAAIPSDTLVAAKKRGEELFRQAQGALTSEEAHRAAIDEAKNGLMWHNANRMWVPAIPGIKLDADAQQRVQVTGLGQLLVDKGFLPREELGNYKLQVASADAVKGTLMVSVWDEDNNEVRLPSNQRTFSYADVLSAHNRVTNTDKQQLVATSEFLRRVAERNQLINPGQQLDASQEPEVAQWIYNRVKDIKNSKMSKVDSLLAVSSLHDDMKAAGVEFGWIENNPYLMWMGLSSVSSVKTILGNTQVADVTPALSNERAQDTGNRLEEAVLNRVGAPIAPVRSKAGVAVNTYGASPGDKDYLARFLASKDGANLRTLVASEGMRLQAHPDPKDPTVRSIGIGMSTNQDPEFLKKAAAAAGIANPAGWVDSFMTGKPVAPLTAQQATDMLVYRLKNFDDVGFVTDRAKGATR